MAGKVYIIGAGPGDYKLVTLKAIECIKMADVIVYDRLVAGKILGFAKENAELIYVGKMPDLHAVPQDGINEILVKKAQEGKLVARVKGGDPFVFGRGGEEVESLYENDIEFEIVPGITSSIAVPAYAGIPVTHRDYCSSLHIITGHERPDKDNSLLDYGLLAKITGTLVFLMGVKNLGEICANLIENGKNPKTPAAVIEKGTTSEQRTAVGVLEDIAGKVKEQGIKSPAVTVIGDVVSLKNKMEWFPKGRLAGKKVLVTRAREQASKLVEKIEEFGGEAIEIPSIKIEKLESFEKFDQALDKLNDYNWLVFTSVNGVKAFFDRMKYKCVDIRNLYGVKLCAVGKATGEELKRLGLTVDYMPEKYTTDELLKGLLEILNPGEKVLLARADIANPDLYKGLMENGINADDLVVYRTILDDRCLGYAENMLQDGKVDFITFTSSSTVSNFVSIIGMENLKILDKSKVVCIGPVTSSAAEEFGIKVSGVADEYTIDGLLKKLLEISEG